MLQQYFMINFFKDNFWKIELDTLYSFKWPYVFEATDLSILFWKREKKIKCAHLMMTECSSAHEENEKKKMGFPTN